VDFTAVTPGLQQLKALSHPVRVRMLGMLRVDGPATATSLAERLGLNTGATSYHLRQLAQHGLIVDDESRGNGRDRWWKAAHDATMTRSDVVQDEAGAEAMDAYLQSVVVVMTQMLQRAVEERPVLPDEWRRASTFSDWVIKLSPARARALIDSMGADLEAFEEDAEDPSAADFVIQVHGFPLPGRLGGGEA
jgi:DNA-binding transcriptional ArsR family regulator